jgi:hypothetical protein
MLKLAQARDWPALCGYALFVSMMAAGYYCNLALSSAKTTPPPHFMVQ